MYQEIVKIDDEDLKYNKDICFFLLSWGYLYEKIEITRIE